MTYSIGHIYKIICTIDSNIIYIGASFNQLRHRFQGHKAKFNKWIKDKDKYIKFSIFDYFEKYGIENFKIILIKSYNVVRTHKKDFKHLHAYELLWINKTKNCCNKFLPFNPLKTLNKKETRNKYYEVNKNKILEKNKKYREENAENIKEIKNKYYQENKDKIAEQAKEYREKNKEKKKEQDNKYYQENKQAIKEHKKQKYNCVCGSTITIGSKARHEKTQLHIQYCKKI